MRVGVFDSGVGGLTVLKNLRKKYPNNDYIYVGDNKNVPYGTKTKEELLILASNIVDFLITKKIDVCVIACGTVSSNIANELREKYELKIIDIITPTIEYIKNNNYRNIGVFATKATINSHVFKNNLNIPVYEEECSEFVPLIESGNINSPEMVEAINKHLKNIYSDEIILGCTHYPLVAHLIPKKTINMGDLIILNENSGNGTCEYYFSKIYL